MIEVVFMDQGHELGRARQVAYGAPMQTQGEWTRQLAATVPVSHPCPLTELSTDSLPPLDIIREIFAVDDPTVWMRNIGAALADRGQTVTAMTVTDDHGPTDFDRLRAAIDERVEDELFADDDDFEAKYGFAKTVQWKEEN
jgi:hypothetical protein